MSSKQFISAEEHLAKLGITVQQANDFIGENVDNPELIFSAARQNGVTNGMLSEITNFSTTVISDYFVSAGFDSKEIDNTSILVNSDLGTLENLVSFNEKTGVLSTSSLKDQVISSINVSIPSDIFINFFFGGVKPYQSLDGFYDSEELGVGHLDNVPATNDSIESLFYGTLINIFSALDESELNQINTFPEDGDPEGFQALLFDSLSEPLSPPLAWADEELAELVVKQATNLIQEYDNNIKLVGIFDEFFTL